LIVRGIYPKTQKLLLIGYNLPDCLLEVWASYIFISHRNNYRFIALSLRRRIFHALRQKVAINKSLIWLLLGLWVLIMLNSVMYRHSHRLPNGKIVSHAHPYKKGTDDAPAKPHEHTDEELALLQLIDGQLFEPPVMLSVSFAAHLLNEAANNFTYLCSFIASCCLQHAGRAPPQV
jgi:hypothetical protein